MSAQRKPSAPWPMRRPMRWPHARAWLLALALVAAPAPLTAHAESADDADLPQAEDTQSEDAQADVTQSDEAQSEDAQSEETQPEDAEADDQAQAEGAAETEDPAGIEDPVDTEDQAGTDDPAEVQDQAGDEALADGNSAAPTAREAASEGEDEDEGNDAAGTDARAPGAGAHAAAAADAEEDAEGEAIEREWLDDTDDAMPTDLSEDPAGQDFDWVVQLPGDDEDIYVDAQVAQAVARPFVLREPAQPNEPDEEAWGGKPVPDTGAPWLAEIFATGPREDPGNPEPPWVAQHECGGALIADDWVLTAAHCLPEAFRRDPSKLAVWLGSEDLSSDDGRAYAIDRFVIHAGWSTARGAARPNMFNDDIALVHIVRDDERSTDARQIRPIAWSDADVDDEDLVTTANWYRFEDDDEGRERALLLKYEMTAPSLAECRGVDGHGEPYKLHERVFCAGHPRRTICRGDSGSPVVLANGPPVLVGITSWGRDTCTAYNGVGVYTRVAKYRDWIARAMRADANVTTLR